MKGNFHKNLNIAFAGAILGVMAFSWGSPYFIRMMFTPPVSFGVNCEPVGTWSMQKLLIAQTIGLVVGVAGIFYLKSKVFGKKEVLTSEK